MKGRVIAVLMLGVLDGLAFPHLALAYRALADDPEIASDVSVVWAASRITLTVSRGDLPSAQREVLATAVEGAVARWNGVACADLELVVGSGTGPAAPEDARNTVEWIANGWALRGFPVGVAATTDIRLQRTDMGAWSIVEADIYVNADEFEWDILGGAGPVSVGPALVHELGHLLGLLHPCEPDAGLAAPICGGDQDASFRLSVLYPDHQENEGRLAADDVEGFCDLYPTPMCAGTTCGPGEVCVAGLCTSSAEQVCGAGADACQRCVTDTECAVREVCLGGLCSPPRPRGSACSSDVGGHIEA